MSAEKKPKKRVIVKKKTPLPWSDPKSNPAQDIRNAVRAIASQGYQPSTVILPPGLAAQVFNINTLQGGFTSSFGGKTGVVQDTDLKHGSVSTYNNHKCRCLKCREALRVYRAEYRAKYKGVPKVSQIKTARAYEL